MIPLSVSITTPTDEVKIVTHKSLLPDIAEGLATRIRYIKDSIAVITSGVSENGPGPQIFWDFEDSTRNIEIARNHNVLDEFYNCINLTALYNRIKLQLDN